MKIKHVAWIMGVCASFSLVSVFMLQQQSPQKNQNDEVLLSIIKNDTKAFEHFIDQGLRLDSLIQLEDKSYQVSEILIKYERLHFLEKFSQLNRPKMENFWPQAIEKNNSELLLGLMKIYPDENLKSKTYGLEKRNLLHLASVKCAANVIGILHQAGMSWSDKDKNDNTALSLAIDYGCLAALSYWKENGADFRKKNSKGISALSLLSQKKDLALKKFAQSFEEKRMIASVTPVKAPEIPQFYKKRQIPKDEFMDRSQLMGPQDRPEEANVTAEFTEFSD